MRRPSLLIVATVLVGLTLVAGRDASAAPLTFHLSPNDVLASVGRTNAFIAALGKRAKGAKRVPDGLSFAGQTCAAFGSVYRLGAVSVLTGPSAVRTLVTTHDGADGAALEAAFLAAGVGSWTPPALDTETSVPFWTALPIPQGLRFAADAVTIGGDAGLIGAAGDARALRFRADVTSAPDADGRYRFLLELYGRTSSQDAPGSLVAFAERRCYAFVDLAPVDLSVLVDLVNTQVALSTLRARLLEQLEGVALDLERRDSEGVFAGLALFLGNALYNTTTDRLSPHTTKRLATTAFNVRRGVEFVPVTATCGDGTRETGEQCDGADLGGFGCTNIGFASGTLGCSANCRFDTSACVADPMCGNGVVEIGEECDHGAANSDTLPNACRTDCKFPHCGDGVIDGFEDCEGRNLDGETCFSLGYDGGSLGCDSECAFDEERCTEEF
jgi:hypothetical protein